MADILAWAAVIIVALAVWLLAGRMSSAGAGGTTPDEVDPISGRGVL